MIMTIKAEFLVGTDITIASKKACQVATHLDVNIEFRFNDACCIAQPNSDYNQLVKDYREALTNKNIKLAIAFSRE
jgi:hypothetical protein